MAAASMSAAVAAPPLMLTPATKIVQPVRMAVRPPRVNPMLATRKNHGHSVFGKASFRQRMLRRLEAAAASAMTSLGGGQSPGLDGGQSPGQSSRSRQLPPYHQPNSSKSRQLTPHHQHNGMRGPHATKSKEVVIPSPPSTARACGQLSTTCAAYPRRRGPLLKQPLPRTGCSASELKQKAWVWT